jgi:DNA polymerase III epsilon subunit-like protein
MPSFSIPAPLLRRRFLVFDAETTGLLPTQRKGAPCIPITEYPHILQLSFVIYDIVDKMIIRQSDAYIKVNEAVEISPFISNLTGITREICNEKGRDIVEVLEEFYEAYMFCDGLVAHNMAFDEKMVMIELERNREVIMQKAPYCFMMFNPMYEKVHGIERYCTMRKGTDQCNIMVPSKVDGKPASKKWPRLNELYANLFNGETVEGLHNSMTDVLVCLRCYLKMRHNFNDERLLA